MASALLLTLAGCGIEHREPLAPAPRPADLETSGGSVTFALGHADGPAEIYRVSPELIDEVDAAIGSGEFDSVAVLRSSSLLCEHTPCTVEVGTERLALLWVPGGPLRFDDEGGAVLPDFELWTPDGSTSLHLRTLRSTGQDRTIDLLAGFFSVAGFLAIGAGALMSFVGLGEPSMGGLSELSVQGLIVVAAGAGSMIIGLPMIPFGQEWVRPGRSDDF